MKTVILLVCVIGFSDQSFSGVEANDLEKKIVAALEQTCYEGCDPIEGRLHALGEDGEVSRVVLKLAKQNKAATKIGSEEYLILSRSVFALGKLKTSEAIPFLAELAQTRTVQDDVTVWAYQSIGSIDPQSTRDVLLAGLKSNEYSVRRAAAEGLSRSNDQSVLFELDVAASQEGTRETSRTIQALADSMRRRLAAEKAPKVPVSPK
jgi:hypothetical protein